MTPVKRQEAAILTLLIPQNMKDAGWRIGRDHERHALTRGYGRTYTLYGATLEAMKADLEKWLWLASE